MRKILLSLGLLCVGFISFCSSFFYSSSNRSFFQINGSATYSTGFVIPSNGEFCFNGSPNNSLSCSIDGHNITLSITDLYCFFNTGSVSSLLDISCTNNGSSRGTFYYWFFSFPSSSCPSCPDCPTCPSCGSCTGYNLNLVYPGIMTDTYSINSDINLNVGQNVSADVLSFPDISLSSTCQNLSGEICGSGDLLRSNIYINNILHPGRQFVNIEIPDYIQWDYSVGDDDFNLYVGSGYDVDYIESVIDINSYRPTSEDFTNVFVSGLTLVMPYIVIALFIIFVRKLLKRIFK